MNTYMPPPRRDHALTDYARHLQSRPTLDVAMVLTQLTEGAVQLLPSVDHAGITVADKGTVSTQSSTGPFPVALDRIQAEYGVGPCLSAAKTDDIVRVDDVEQDPRWPAYSRAAVAHTPIRSVLSLALVTDSPGVSALNVYAEKPQAFDIGMTQIAQMYAAYTAMTWTLARRDEQFHLALDSRDTIGQAKGMLMERFKIDATQAFGLLKRLSQSSNTPLAQVAAKLVEAEQHGS